MPARGWAMISLTVVTALSSASCFRQPLPAGVDGLPSLSPQVEPLSLGPNSYYPAGQSNGSLSENPWQPKAAERDWEYIVIHHTATDRGNVESIHETHLKRTDSSGKHWLGIGYHFVIGNGNGMGDGAVEPTFRWREQLQGAHAGTSEYNQRGIGIALVGNFEEHPPTAAQLAAIKNLVTRLKAAYGITSEHVVGHGSVKATDCPGRYFPLAEVSAGNPSWWLGLRSTELETESVAVNEGNRTR